MSRTSIVVVGHGAEGSHGPLGLAVSRAVLAGFPVVGFDPSAALGSCLRGGPGEALDWVVAETSPQLVLVESDVPRDLLGATARDARTELCDGSHLVSRLEELVASAPAGTAAPPAAARPVVSFLIAFYNCKDFVLPAIESCIAQTFPDWEVIAVDDGSTDGTAELLDLCAARDPRIRVVHQRNIGGTGRMDQVWNAGARTARGEFLAFLGGDDVNEPWRLAEQLAAFADDPRLDVVHGAALTTDVAGRVSGQAWHLITAYDDASLLRDLTPVCLVGHPSVMVRRSVFDALGGMEDGLTCDYQFWVKAAGRHRFRFLPRRLVRYRHHGAALSTTTDGNERTRKDGYRVRRTVLARRGVHDLFPELADRGTDVLRSDAMLSLGNAVVTEDPELAHHFYEAAVGLHAGESALVNLAVTSALLGDYGAARRLAATAGGPGDLLEVAVREGTWTVGDVMPPRSDLAEVFSAWRRASRGVAAWDGSDASVSSLYLHLDDPAGPPARAVVETWAQVTTPDTRMRWVIPTLGRSEQETYEHFLVAARGVDLSGAADVVIDAVDDLTLVPVRHDGVRGTVTGPEGAWTVCRWIRDSADVLSPR